MASRNSLEIPKYLGMQASGEYNEHYEYLLYPNLLEKRKKMVAKLVAAGKLVGI